MKYARLMDAICVVAVVVSIVLVPSVLTANESPEFKGSNSTVTIDDGNFTVTMQNVDIDQYIASVSKLFSKTFLVDSRVNGRINISKTGPLNANEYYDFFVTVMQKHGYVVVEDEDVTRIGLDQAKGDSEGRLITPKSTLDEQRQSISPLEMTLALPFTAGEFRDLVKRDVSLLNKVLSVEPYRVDGKLNGYRILPSKHNPGVLETYGILDGDVLSIVNNIKLDSQKQGIRALRNAIKANSLEIVVIRDKKEIPITISLER